MSRFRGLWLGSTDKLRTKQHFWGMITMPNGEYPYSMCGLFGSEKEFVLSDADKCKRCVKIKGARE